jgi:acetyl-CoA carboxylase biotin carboxyl carrier protein
MTVDEIRQLIGLATETGIAELEVQHGEERVRIRRDVPPAPREIVFAGTPPFVASQPAPPAGSVPVPAAAPAASSANPVASREKEMERPADPAVTLVKSPIVGTFYECPSPGAPAFVRPGDRVQPGKVLCIIESMKLMNEIEAEVGGIVESKLVMNGQPVEYGEALFAIRAI